MSLIIYLISKKRQIIHLTLFWLRNLPSKYEFAFSKAFNHSSGCFLAPTVSAASKHFEIIVTTSARVMVSFGLSVLSE